MPDTKSLISSLRSLSTSVCHADIEKSTLFQEAAAEIERLDKALYEEKGKTRRLTRELEPYKLYDRERREIVTLKEKAKEIPGIYDTDDNTIKALIGMAKKKLLTDMALSNLIDWKAEKEAGYWTVECTVRALHPRGDHIPADPAWFSRNHIDLDSPLMTE